MASFRNSGAPMDRTPRNALFLGTKSFKSSYRRLSVCKAKTVCTSWRQARLVSAQPIDEFVVQICQTQEAHCNIARPVFAADTPRRLLPRRPDTPRDSLMAR